MWEDLLVVSQHGGRLDKMRNGEKQENTGAGGLHLCRKSILRIKDPIT